MGNWFNKLQNKYRVIITAAAWVLMVIVAGIFGSQEPMPIWQSIIIVALLAVSIVFTVYAVRAYRAEHPKQEKPQAQPTTSAALPTRTKERAPQKEIKYSKTPRWTVRLVKYSSSKTQDSISDCDVGDLVDISYDYDCGLFECFVSDTIGYLPQKTSEAIYNDDLEDSVEVKITNLIENEESGLTAVEVSIYQAINEVVLPIKTKAVGITFNNRQENIKASNPNDGLIIKHSPLPKFPEATLIINARTQQEIGSINKELAIDLLSAFGQDFTLIGCITDITGGESDKPMLGCNIEITESK